MTSKNRWHSANDANLISEQGYIAASIEFSRLRDWETGPAFNFCATRTGTLRTRTQGATCSSCSANLDTRTPMITSVYAQLVDESYESLAECVPGEALK